MLASPTTTATVSATVTRRAPQRRLSRLLALLLTLLLTGFVLIGFAGTANAADGYRYWNYFHLDKGTWAFSQVGGGDYVPEDGDVEGYRYGTSTTADGIAPRADLSELTFQAICGEADAGAGEKRVGVLIDFGTEADAEGGTPPEPRGACAVVPEKASGQVVLDAVADVRAENGLTCGIDGYPVQGCGTEVPGVEQSGDEATVAFALPEDGADAGAAASEDGSQDSGLLWPLVGVGALVAVIGAATLTLQRRNKSAA